MSSSELIHYISGHPAAFGFEASLPHDKSTLDPASKMTDPESCRLSLVCQLLPLKIEQLISHTRTALVDSIDSLQGFHDGMIAASEVYELLSNIHDILDNVVSTQVGNSGSYIGLSFQFCFQAVM